MDCKQLRIGLLLFVAFAVGCSGRSPTDEPPSELENSPRDSNVTIENERERPGSDGNMEMPLSTPEEQSGAHRVVGALEIGRLNLDVDEYNRTLSFHEVAIEGVLRQVAMNRSLRIGYEREERHVLELWTESMEFDPSSRSFVPKVIWCVFDHDEGLEELVAGQKVTVLGTLPQWEEHQESLKVIGCKVLSSGPKPEGAAPAVKPMSVEEGDAQRKQFQAAIQRLVELKLAGYSLPGWLGLQEAAVTEEGLIDPRVIDEFPNLATTLHVPLWSELSPDGLKQLTQLPGIRGVSLRLPFRRLALDDIQILTAWPLEEIELARGATPISDDLLAALSAIKSLRRLELEGKAFVSDEGLAAIAKLSNLQELDISGSNLTDDGLAPLANLDNLHTLMFSSHKLTGQGVVHLKDLPHLFELSLNIADADAESLAAIAECQGLTWLAISAASSFSEKLPAPKIGDAGFVRNLPRLQVLVLSGVEGIAEGFGESLGSVQSLIGLEITYSEIPDEAMVALELPKLKVLNLEHTDISDASVLAMISTTPKLSRLNLASTPVTDAVIAELPRLAPNLTYLNLSEVNVTDESFPYLLKLQKLRGVVLPRSIPTPKQEEFRDQHPNRPSFYY